ncbi:tetratricopeptide repeat-containing sulfotransferase family protein [Ferrimonas balearica]|uniref:tetratricopeptide repeat-containing sulfotransferase family protein n=1 Tax=Ferrimonas balearica TaxID=44012 RepID=UPI001C99FF2B|nr:sulfotransferase [Ferrimonas balearica]MBY5992211.1 sulfotransferase [Ferrimonas balearica]
MTVTMANPDFNPAGVAHLVRTALEKGDLAGAVDLCRTLNQQAPEYAPGWLLASEIALALGNGDNALALAQRAARLGPDTRIGLQMVRCLRQLSRYQEGREAALAIGTLDQRGPGSDRAWLLTELGCYEAAAGQYRHLLSLYPEDAGLHYSLATVLRYLGELDGAEQALDTAIALDPEDDDAWYLRSSLRRQSEARHHIDTLQLTIAKRDRPCPALHYALAKEWEDLGCHDAAFESLATGAAQRRAQIPYQVEQDLEIMAAIAEQFGPDTQPRPTPSGPVPIFVLGLPRTGSTLVERILDAHPGCHGAGELNDFAQLMSRQARQQARQQGRALRSTKALVAQSAQLDFAALGQAYLASLPPEAAAAPMFVDKMPLNFLYVGLILRALPQARIVHVRRHPVATGYAIYKQWFDRAYPFSYDLTELGRYYQGYHELMAHWARCHPGRIHHLDYEALVDEPQETVRALLGHCGLPWDEQVLAFNRNPSASTTASAAQVRQPLYRDARDLWRHYEGQLAPLIQTLEKAGLLGQGATKPV